MHTSFPETQTIDMTCHNPSPTATLSVSYTLAHDLYLGEGNTPEATCSPGGMMIFVR